MIQSQLTEDFMLLLESLAKNSNVSFSGAGLVLYKRKMPLSMYHCNLNNATPDYGLLRMGTKKFLTYLMEISHYQHPYHDGFHFINAEGILTHVAQFFSPPIVHSFVNLPGQGARTFCARCGSKIEGVLMVGSVSSTNSISLFQNGELISRKLISRMEVL